MASSLPEVWILGYAALSESLCLAAEVGRSQLPKVTDYCIKVAAVAVADDEAAN